MTGEDACRMKVWRKILNPWIFALFFIGAIPVLGQSRTNDDVRKEIRQAEAEIARINNLLGTTRKEQGATLGHLNLLETKLKNRQSVIRGLESEMEGVGAQVTAKAQDVTKLQNLYDELKNRYSALIRVSYKNYRNNSYLSFIFSAQDFSDASRRLYYVKRVGLELEKKAKELEEVSYKLGVEISELNDRRTELSGLQKEHRTELGKMEQEKGDLRKTQDQLKGKEKELLAEAEKRRKQVAELETQLQRMIAEEVRKGKGTASAPEGASLTAQFEARKGRLLRPVEGVVVDKYGLHNHPTQKGVKINNKGINVAAREGADVSAIYGGEVRKVFFFQGLGNSVMVRHGSYLSIYANLGLVYVREGETVLEGQTIGTIARAPEGQQSTLHFEVWKESENLDPEQWIRP